MSDPESPETHLRELLTPRQVAELFNLSPRTLANWRLRGGGPPFIKLGSRVVYSTEAVCVFVRQHTFASTAEYGRAP